MNLRFLLPQQPAFFNLFKELSVYLTEITGLFKELATTFNDFKQYSQRAKEIEHRADAKTHEISDKLNKTFITPFDREDIYLLAHEIDDVVDLIENVIHNLELYHIHEKKEFIDEFANLFVTAADNLDKLMDCLANKKCAISFDTFKVKIHDLEDEGDVVFQKSIHNLFAEEKDCLAVVKWKDILENLEMIMDKYQRVCDVVEGIIVKSS